MNETLKTVTIAQPGARQESMRAFLSAAERLELVGSAAGALTGWQLVRTLAPDLVVIEGGLPDEEVSLLLHYLNGDSNPAYSLVFASTPGQERAAWAAGASAVLAGNATLGEFGQAISQMIAARQAASRKTNAGQAIVHSSGDI